MLSDAQPRLLIIGGPTGAGKSAIAVETARLLDGEIVSADSVQLYRHCDIGSAKPDAAMRRAVPHHLIDVAEPDRPFTLADFRAAAADAIDGIVARGKTPIVCGGTGLYIKALLEGLQGGAQSDPSLRQELLLMPLPQLYARLRSLDSARAAVLHPNDRHRILRGVENALLPKNNAPPTPSAYNFVFFIIAAPRGIIYRRIEERVDAMLAGGLLDETKALLARYPADCKPLMSVGYRQAVMHLRGELDADDLAAEIKKATRHYAKRQITWFSSVRGGIWINAGAPVTGGAAAFIADYFKGQKGRAT